MSTAAPEFQMDVFPPGWILQEDAPIPAVEHTLLSDLHSGHPLKAVSTDSASFHIYICRGIFLRNRCLAGAAAITSLPEAG